jgi:2'-5' RNA ligase
MARIRTFIAVALSEPIRDAVVALQKELARTGTAVKWVEPENLHVTLVFLGEVEDRAIPQVCRITTDAVRGHAPFRLTVERTSAFPSPRRPRTLWVGIGAGVQELTAIHDALEPPLKDLGYRMEDRQYTPHVTLGRIKSDNDTDQLAAALTKRAGWTGGEMTVHEVCVLSSELTPDGPIYTVLGRAPLGSGGE